MTETNEKKISDALEKGLESIGLDVQKQQKQKLLAYLALLEKWNRAYNLSAIRDREEMVSKHLLDSLVVFSILKQDGINILTDIGSGAGLPGIPLAIISPQWNISLVDSNGKKAGFLRQAKTQLQLDNITVINDRVENIQQPVDAIICRAFASLKNIIELASGMLDKKSTLWAMKGRYPNEELSELPKPYMVSASHTLVVPGCEGERHLLKIVHE